MLYIHVTLVPYLSAAGELKTKPTQHSVKELAGLGIQPDIIVCRSEKPIPRDVRAKIGLFCNIPADCVFENLNARSIYEVPLMIHEEGMDERVCRLLGISGAGSRPDRVARDGRAPATPQKDVRIAIVGKYVELPDAYLSIVEALTHGGIAHHAKVRRRMDCGGRSQRRKTCAKSWQAAPACLCRAVSASAVWKARLPPWPVCARE